MSEFKSILSALEGKHLRAVLGSLRGCSLSYDAEDDVKNIVFLFQCLSLPSDVELKQSIVLGLIQNSPSLKSNSIAQLIDCTFTFSSNEGVKPLEALFKQTEVNWVKILQVVSSCENYSQFDPQSERPNIRLLLQKVSAAPFQSNVVKQVHSTAIDQKPNHTPLYSFMVYSVAMRWINSLCKEGENRQRPIETAIQSFMDSQDGKPMTLIYFMMLVVCLEEIGKIFNRHKNLVLCWSQTSETFFKILEKVRESKDVSNDIFTISQVRSAFHNYHEKLMLLFNQWGQLNGFQLTERDLRIIIEKKETFTKIFFLLEKTTKEEDGETLMMDLKQKFDIQINIFRERRTICQWLKKKSVFPDIEEADYQDVDPTTKTLTSLVQISQRLREAIPLRDEEVYGQLLFLISKQSIIFERRISSLIHRNQEVSIDDIAKKVQETIEFFEKNTSTDWIKSS
eukprot:TRINITY_DN4089_c0_g2_i1.p1 TRINITY_DN4089_c0_g2~~TRINITY_DN4089_c0_g2_i1.p1  ORF type:complete len:519 (-),score=81.97 TRINITY_DN4089_c0_g2_i1:239-1597(-)